MPDAIARANIEHYKQLLETETDAQKRRVLDQLLAEQQQKLAAVLRAQADRKKS
jgi:hypothetical protein